MTHLRPDVHEDVDAVVWDLDGTLVRLVVDWETVEAAIEDRLTEAGVPTHDHSAWELLDAAEAAGVGGSVHELIADYERDGAARSERLAGADRLVECGLPSAVCSLNAEDACRIALDRHDLAGHVRAVVGRDSVDARKPDPGPLLAAVRALDAEPSRTLFVGDSDSDRVTAERAGTRFERV